jgi:hypothetical protein
LLVLVVAVFSVVSASDELSAAGAQVSAGSTSYVSPDGSDAAAGTEATPFRTIQRAASSNATEAPVIVGMEIRGNRGAGLYINGDLSQGGNGLITGARIERNVIYGNGEKGGSAINCDGIQESLIRDNLLYGNHTSGISLYRIDAAEGARNNVVVNNTIRMAPDGGWAINIKNRSTGNTVSNNVLLHDGTRGAINIVLDSLSGFASDHNAVTNRFSKDDGESSVTLAQWRNATNQDGNSWLPRV